MARPRFGLTLLALLGLAALAIGWMRLRQPAPLVSSETLLLERRVQGPASPVDGARVSLYSASRAAAQAFQLTFPCELRREVPPSNRRGALPTDDELAAVRHESAATPLERSVQMSWPLARLDLSRFACREGARWLTDQHDHPKPEATGRTNALGELELPLPSSGHDWELLIERDGFHPETLLVDQDPAEKAAGRVRRTVTMAADTQRERVLVVDEGGRRLSRARVVAFVGSPPMPTPVHPLFDLGQFAVPGAELIAAYTDDMLLAIRDDGLIAPSLDSACREPPGLLTLHPPRALEGKVTQDGAPVANAVVTLAAPCARGKRDHQTGPSGEFVFENLQPGTWTLSAASGGKQGQLTVEIGRGGADGGTAPTAPTEVTLDLDSRTIPPSQRRAPEDPQRRALPAATELTPEEWLLYWADAIQTRWRQMVGASVNALANSAQVDTSLEDPRSIADQLEAMPAHERRCWECQVLELPQTPPTATARNLMVSALALCNRAATAGGLGAEMAGLVPPRGGPSVGELRARGCAECGGPGYGPKR